jgi:hypothetical protein
MEPNGMPPPNYSSGYPSDQYGYYGDPNQFQQPQQVNLMARF